MDKIQKQFKVGLIRATVWKNKGINKACKETEYNTVSLSRSYKDEKGEWKNTNSLKANDLPKAILALQKAHEQLTLKEGNKKDNKPEKSEEYM